MRDANEIFGDVDELLTIRKKGLASSERMERRLEDEFEPTVLSEKYMTGKDDEIRQLDIPERMQVCFLSMGYSFLCMCIWSNCSWVDVNIPCRL